MLCGVKLLGGSWAVPEGLTDINSLRDVSGFGL